MSALALGRAGARPAVVPGQSPARRNPAGAGSSLDQPPSPALRHRLLHHGADVAALPERRAADRAARQPAATGLFPIGTLAFPEMAGAGSDPLDVGLRRDDGRAARPEAAELPGAARRPAVAARLRRGA